MVASREPLNKSIHIGVLLCRREAAQQIHAKIDLANNTAVNAAFKSGEAIDLDCEFRVGSHSPLIKQRNDVLMS